jgi:hypothetical protein
MLHTAGLQAARRHQVVVLGKQSFDRCVHLLPEGWFVVRIRLQSDSTDDQIESDRTRWSIRMRDSEICWGFGASAHDNVIDIVSQACTLGECGAQPCSEERSPVLPVNEVTQRRRCSRRKSHTQKVDYFPNQLVCYTSEVSTLDQPAARSAAE